MFRMLCTYYLQLSCFESLYIITLSVGFVYDNINLLSLTFFFLVLSAVEFGIGLVIMLLQNIFFRSLQLHDNSKN